MSIVDIMKNKAIKSFIKQTKAITAQLDAGKPPEELQDSIHALLESVCVDIDTSEIVNFDGKQFEQACDILRNEVFGKAYTRYASAAEYEKAIDHVMANIEKATDWPPTLPAIALVILLFRQIVRRVKGDNAIDLHHSYKAKRFPFEKFKDYRCRSNGWDAFHLTYGALLYRV